MTHLESAAIAAQATLHHAYLLGLQLMVASREPPAVVEEWMFRLFRRQHEDKFLSSFSKLGLHDLPDAVACARYHALSNSIGGVPVEYAFESDRKAWVRFRYPRWMFAGPTLCGVPVEASRGFLRGWYAHNGVSLGNRRLGFVCVSEDMTGEYGLCGYFFEHGSDLADDERLRFAQRELPPDFSKTEQPHAPRAEWDNERLQKAKRNYAMDYIRNGIPTLAQTLGPERARELGARAARLIGLQYYSELAQAVAAVDGDFSETAKFLARMFAGMGDDVSVSIRNQPKRAAIEQRGLRIVRGLDGGERAVLLSCWNELWIGAVHSHATMKTVRVESTGDGQRWTVADET